MSRPERRKELQKQHTQEIEEEKRKREEHDERYAIVANKLQELGINPYELRDYLTGLIGNG